MVHIEYYCLQDSVPNIFKQAELDSDDLVCNTHILW